jgi:hypothetical protein
MIYNTKMNEKMRPKYITDNVYFEEDNKNIYVIYVKTKEQDTYSKKHYYIYGGSSKSLQIYAMGNNLAVEYSNAGWNEPSNAKNMRNARGLSENMKFADFINETALLISMK